ncbi:sugar kinase, partial [Thioclava sp. BHET1]
FHYWREQAAARRLFQTESGISFAALEGFDVIYLSGITLAILPAAVRSALGDWLADARARGIRLAFDSNYRPRLWSSVEEARSEIGRLWALCEIGLPSVDDEMALFGEPSEREVLFRLRQLGLRQGALKRGAAGPIALD